MLLKIRPHFAPISARPKLTAKDRDARNRAYGTQCRPVNCVRWGMMQCDGRFVYRVARSAPSSTRSARARASRRRAIERDSSARLGQLGRDRRTAERLELPSIQPPRSVGRRRVRVGRVWGACLECTMRVRERRVRESGVRVTSSSVRPSVSIGGWKCTARSLPLGP
jgi:hypothetical protein